MHIAAPACAVITSWESGAVCRLQVQTLLSVLCKETELAELELKVRCVQQWPAGAAAGSLRRASVTVQMGSFEVKVRRSAATSNGAGPSQMQARLAMSRSCLSSAVTGSC